MVFSEIKQYKQFKRLNKLKKDIFAVICIFFDTFVLMPPVSHKVIFDVCVVKVDALGDYILSLDSLHNIFLKYKGKRIVFICNQIVYELAMQLDIFDEIYPIEIEKFEKNYFYRISKLRELKKFKIKISLQPTFSRNVLIGDSIIRAINSKINIGHYGDYTNQSKFLKYLGNNWYTKLFHFKNKVIHELDINEKFLNFIKIKKIKKFKIKKLENLKKINFNFNKNYLVISPGASDHSRALPINRYILLIKYILTKSDYFIILCGSKNDLKITNIIKQNVLNNKLIDYTGKTTISELIEIIRLSKFVIGNDSASIHIAYSLKVKSICFSGGNNFKRFVPYSKSTKFEYKPTTIYSNDCYKNNWKCCKENKCIDKISLDKVLNVIDKYI